MFLNGRTRRRVIFAFFVGEVALAFLIYSQAEHFASSAADLIIVLQVAGLVLTVPWLALCVRRLHDMNVSGWWLLGYYVAWGIASAAVSVLVSEQATAIVAGAGHFGLLAWLTTPGTVGPNRFGPDPRGRIAQPAEGAA